LLLFHGSSNFPIKYADFWLNSASDDGYNL